MRWLLVVSLCAPMIAAQEQLPIPNAGFEADADNDGRPDGWSFSWQYTHSNDRERGIKKQEPDWGRDTAVKHSGEASIRVGVRRPQDDGVWTLDGLKLPPGQKYYRLRAWLRGRNVKGANGRVAAVYLGADKKWLGAQYGAITVDRDCEWTQFTGYLELPKNAATLRLRCWVNMDYSGTGTFWFDDLELTPVDHIEKPKTVYLDETPLPQPTAEERRRGFMLFSRSYLRLLFPNSIPRAEERLQKVSLAACRAEREPAIVAVHALRDLADVKLSVSDLKSAKGTLPASSVEVRSVRYHPKEGQSRWGPFNETLMEVPLFLERRASIALAAQRTQPFWLTVHVPEKAASGTYTGTVTVSVTGSPAAQLPLELEVHPFELAAPKGLTFAMYTKMRDDPAWIAETFADMRAHGLTSVALCGNSGLALSTENGEVKIDWNGESALEQNMAEYVKAGFPEPMVWLMGGDIPRFCEKIGPLESEAFAEAYRQVIEAIRTHGRESGWPEIIYQPIDEPFEHAKHMARAIRLLQILKTIPNLRTEEDGPNGRWENFTEEVYQLTDVIVLHDGPVLNRGTLDMDGWRDFLSKARADKKEIWFYNVDLTAWHPEPIRFMTGFGLWKSGATGVIEWAYMFPVKPEDPAAVYRQPRALLYRFPAAPGESGGPCVAYEAVREGVDDYRYLLTLQQLVEQAKASGSAAAGRVAEQAWKAVQERLDAASFEGCKGRAGQGNWTGKCEILPDGNRAVRGDHKIPNNWDFSEYDALRAQIAHSIVALQKALGG